jgi:hypothetical protein
MIPITTLKESGVSRKVKITETLENFPRSQYLATILTVKQSYCSKCILVSRGRHLQADNVAREWYCNGGSDERGLNWYAKRGLIIIYTCTESVHRKRNIANR